MSKQDYTKKSLSDILDQNPLGQTVERPTSTDSVFGSMSKSNKERVIYVFPYNGQLGDMTDAAKEEITQLSNYAIGACEKTGLTVEEERILIPILTDVQTTDNAYQLEKRRFYESLHYAVPANGLSLNITLPNPELPVSDENMPERVLDYVKYRQLMVNPKVAKSRDEAETNPFIRFYIEDRELENVNKLKKVERQEKASEFYKEIYQTDDEPKARRFLILNGFAFHEVRAMSKAEVFTNLKDFSYKKPEEFIETYQDKHTDSRYAILELLQAGILKEIGTKIYITKSQQEIGKNREEAAIYLSDNTNAMLRASLEEEFRHKYK